VQLGAINQIRRSGNCSTISWIVASRRILIKCNRRAPNRTSANHRQSRTREDHYVSRGQDPHYRSSGQMLDTTHVRSEKRSFQVPQIPPEKCCKKIDWISRSPRRSLVAKSRRCVPEHRANVTLENRESLRCSRKPGADSLRAADFPERVRSPSF